MEEIFRLARKEKAAHSVQPMCMVRNKNRRVSAQTWGLSWIFCLFLFSSAANGLQSCEPCIERTDFTIQVIVHATVGDPFWKLMEETWRQGAKDFRVQLKYAGAYQSEQDVQDRMADDILKIRDDPPDALLVTVPNEKVKNAVEQIVGLVPTFGINSGFKDKVEGIKAYVSSDDYLGGVIAATKFKTLKGVKKALFINHEKGNGGMQERFAGFYDAFQGTLRDGYPEQVESVFSAPEESEYRCGCASCNDLAWNFIASDANGDYSCGSRITYLKETFEEFEEEEAACIRVANIEFADECGNCDPLTCTNEKEEYDGKTEVDHLELVTFDESEVTRLVDEKLRGCTFDVVLLSARRHFDIVKEVYDANECDFSEQVLGVFDTSLDVYGSLTIGDVAFAVSQQQHLQGMLGFSLAALYATLGMTLSPSDSNPFGVYLTGPKLVDLNSMPKTDALQACEEQSFFVCDRNQFEKRGKCPCITRDSITVGVVTPDPYASPGFWLQLWKGVKQAAFDLNLNLAIDQLQRADETQNSILSEKIKSVCISGVDGMITAIKSDAILESVKFCSNELDIPVIAVSNDASLSKEAGLDSTITMVDFDAAFQAGEKLIEAGVEVGYCINWHASNDLDARCLGFQAALEKYDKKYGGVIYPPPPTTFHDNLLYFQELVEASIPDTGAWDGLGFMLVSDAFSEGILSVKKAHANILVGTFDHGKDSAPFLDDDDLLLTIDSQPYLQGYLAVLLMVNRIFTQEFVQTHSLLAGPKIHEEVLSETALECLVNEYEVCEPPVQYVKNQLDSVRPFGLVIAAIIIALSIAFSIWTVVNRNARILVSSQPSLLLLICAGAIITASTIIPLSLDDAVLNEDGGCVGCECPGCNRACMASPWLFFLGFTIIFTALYSKIRRVNVLIASAVRFRRVHVKVMDVMVPFFVILGLNMIFLTAWTLGDPMFFQRSQRCGSDMLTSYGSCRIGDGPLSLWMASSLICVNFLAVVMATYQAFKARNISTEFSESSFVGMAMGCIMQIMLVGIPLGFLVADSPPAKFFVLTAIVSVVCLSVMLLMFIPKVYALRRFRRFQAEMEAKGHDIDESSWMSSTRGHIYTTNSGSQKFNLMAHALRKRQSQHASVDWNMYSSSAFFPSTTFGPPDPSLSNRGRISKFGRVGSNPNLSTIESEMVLLDESKDLRLKSPTDSGKSKTSSDTNGSDSSSNMASTMKTDPSYPILSDVISNFSTELSGEIIEA